MHRLIGTATITALLALAAPAAAAPRTRLGTLDMRRAFNECRAGKLARERLRTDFEKKQKRLDADQEELKKLLAKGSTETDATKRDALGKQVQEKTRRLQDLYKRFQKELEDAEKGAIQKLLRDLRALVPAVAQSLKLQGVMEAEGVYFTGPEVERVDVTAEVVKRLDAATPGTKGAAQKGAPARIPTLLGRPPRVLQPIKR